MDWMTLLSIVIVALVVVVPMVVVFTIIEKSAEAAWSRLKHYQCLRRVVDDSVQEEEFFGLDSIKDGFSWGFKEGLMSIGCYCFVHFALLVGASEWLGECLAADDFVLGAVFEEAPAKWARRRWRFAAIMTVIVTLAGIASLGGYYYYLFAAALA